jgi:hypothetical protein
VVARRRTPPGGLRTAAFLVALLNWIGCQHTVTLPDIEPIKGDPIPVTARVEIPPESADRVHKVRSFAAGITSSWTIEVGDALVRYADAFLTPVFPKGDDVVIEISIDRFDIAMFRAILEARISVTRDGRGVFDKHHRIANKRDRRAAQMNRAQSMDSALMSTTDEALRSLFEQFLEEARLAYPSW